MLLLNRYEALSIKQASKIAQNIHGFFIWKDKKHRYLDGNEEAGAFVQLPSTQSLIGQTDSELGFLEGGHTCEFFNAIDKQVMQGKPYINQKEIVIQKNKSNRTTTKIVLSSKIPLMHNGICIGIVLQAADITHLTFPNFAPSNVALKINASKINFTNREKDCISLLLKGYSCKRMAHALQLSHRTVEHYIENLRQKMQCLNKQELLNKLHDIMLS